MPTKRIISILVTAFTFIPISAFVLAQEAIYQEQSLEGLLDLPYIEIATGTAVPLEKAQSVATLITAKDIKAMGALLP